MEFEKIYPHTENLESGIHPETIMILLTLKSVWIGFETQGLADYSSLNVLGLPFKGHLLQLREKGWASSGLSPGNRNGVKFHGG
jgi:hypothetical protein